jgi:hypothetical protein
MTELARDLYASRSAIGRIAASLLVATLAVNPAHARNAMALSPDGHGQVLIYPYYTVNGGNLTLLTIENTRDESKAVRVRFREALNGRVVLQLSLYLGPQDMWTAAIMPDGGVGAVGGPARLYTPDSSCTLPRVTAVGLPFSARDYIDNTATGGPNRQDHPSALQATHSAPERTRSGSIEVIEMGVLRPGAAPTQLAEEVAAQPPAEPLVDPAQPADCNAVARAWLAGNGGWADLGAARDIDLPRGGLAGTAAIVDVADGTLMGYRAEAVAGFYTNATAPGALHHAPDAAAPDLGDCDHGNGRCQVLFPLNNGPSHRFVFGVGGDRAWDAFSTLFIAQSVESEYVTDAGIAARTEVVLGAPTKQHYVDRPQPPRSPFASVFPATGQACDSTQNIFWNREELTGPPGSVFPGPPQPPPPRPCFQSSILTFNESAQVGAILGQRLAFAFNGSTTSAGNVVNNPTAAPRLADGNSRISSANVSSVPAWIDVDDDATFGGPRRLGRVFGLPWSGVAFRTAVNANAQPGLLARYGGAWTIRRQRVFSPPLPIPAVDKESTP